MSSTIKPRIQPDARFLVAHPAHLVALGFGSGLPPRAPGTFGTLFGWASFALIAPRLALIDWVIVLLLGFGLGCWACQKTGVDLGAPDHGAMVWDEIIAFWLVLLFTPATLPWQVLAFVAFRFFDIVKPRPIRSFERRFKSGGWAGFGVMGDDLIAAFYSLVTIAVAVRVLAWIEGSHR